MSRCEARHPEQDIACTVSEEAAHESHYHRPTGTSWPNPDFVLPLDRPRQAVKDLANKQRKENQDRNTAGARGEHAYLPHNPTDTQVTAADVARGGSVRSRDRVYAAIVEQPRADFQLSAQLGIVENTVRPRRKELLEDGLIEDSGERVLNPATQQPCTVWRAT